MFRKFTYLGRDIAECYLLKYLITQSSPKGATVMNLACSTGAESFVLSMLLGDKYPIKASDISADAIKMANIGEYPVGRNKIENKIFNQDYYLNHNNSVDSIKNPLERKFKELFNQHFLPVEATIESKTAANSYDTYKPSDQLKKNVSFCVEDIENISKIGCNENPPIGAVILKNAWSYLFSNEKGEVRINKNAEEVFSKVSNVVKKISTLLPQNGVFSTGNCPFDYIVFDNNNQIVKPSPLVEIFKNNNFKPVNESIQNISRNGFSMKIPTIWKKI